LAPSSIAQSAGWPPWQCAATGRRAIRASSNSTSTSAFEYSGISGSSDRLFGVA
jgi:hypothetical protein